MEIKRKYINNNSKKFFKYLSLLNSLDFRNNHDLLKYFGLSFFHDFNILSLTMDLTKKTIQIKVTSDVILEEINDFREKYNLPEITYNSFFKNPIIYNCNFFNISDFKYKVDLYCENFIIDTEILSFSKSKGYKLSIYFDNQHYLSFYTRKTNVEIQNKDLIIQYHNNLNKKINYCSVCKGKLLSKTKIRKLFTGKELSN